MITRVPTIPIMPVIPTIPIPLIPIIPKPLYFPIVYLPISRPCGEDWILGFPSTQGNVCAKVTRLGEITEWKASGLGV